MAYMPIAFPSVRYGSGGLVIPVATAAAAAALPTNIGAVPTVDPIVVAQAVVLNISPSDIATRIVSLRTVKGRIVFSEDRETRRRRERD